MIIEGSLSFPACVTTKSPLMPVSTALPALLEIFPSRSIGWPGMGRSGQCGRPRASQALRARQGGRAVCQGCFCSGRERGRVEWGSGQASQREGHRGCGVGAGSTKWHTAFPAVGTLPVPTRMCPAHPRPPGSGSCWFPGSCNKPPQTCWLKTEVSSLTAPRVRSLRSVSLGANQGPHRALFPPASPGQNLFFSSRFCDCRHSWAWACIAPLCPPPAGTCGCSAPAGNSRILCGPKSLTQSPLQSPLCRIGCTVQRDSMCMCLFAYMPISMALPILLKIFYQYL